MHKQDLPLSGCDVSWDAMVGDERARHCAICDQQVTDLSAGTEADARALIATGAGCVRYRVDRTGRILFRREVAALAASATILLAATASAEPMGVSSGVSSGVCAGQQDTTQVAPIAAAEAPPEPDVPEGGRIFSILDASGHPAPGGEVRIRGPEGEISLPIDPGGRVVLDPEALGWPPLADEQGIELWVTVHGYETVYWSGPGQQVVVQLRPHTEILMGGITAPPRRRPFGFLRRLFR